MELSSMCWGGSLSIFNDMENLNTVEIYFAISNVAFKKIDYNRLHQWNNSYWGLHLITFQAVLKLILRNFWSLLITDVVLRSWCGAYKMKPATQMLFHVFFAIQWLMSRTPIQRRLSCHRHWSSERTAKRRTETARRTRTPRSWKLCHVSAWLLCCSVSSHFQSFTYLAWLGSDASPFRAISKMLFEFQVHFARWYHF